MLEHLQRCPVCDPPDNDWMKKKSKYAGLVQENGFDSE
jgi:hypothetical protein